MGSAVNNMHIAIYLVNLSNCISMIAYYMYALCKEERQGNDSVIVLE